jgi:cytidylate kinase
MIITIDGPAGSGKSTAARMLAEKLGVRFLDTGAMYRSIALAALRAGVAPEDADAVTRVAEHCRIDMPDNRILLNGADVTMAIREPEVTYVASIVAAHAGVRRRLVALQQAVAQAGPLVTEGRDQGTIVFPNAACKFFLTASLAARAARRQAELSRKSIPSSLEEVTEQIQQRDERDEQRATAPMKPADDALLIDTSDLSIEQVVQLLLNAISQRSEG